MTQTLTTERLREIASGDAFICTQDDESVAMARELLANREAQPVTEPYMYELWKWDETVPDLDRWFLVERSREKLVAGKQQNVVCLYTAPPAPAVPDAIEPTFEAIKAILPTANPDEYACCIGADMWNACRAAMLAQPVSQGGKLPDNVREALTLALQAMEFMGDTLNNIDAVCTEDVEYVTPAFNAIRSLLAAAPEVGN